jgi:hypothetical protein
MVMKKVGFFSAEMAPAPMYSLAVYSYSGHKSLHKMNIILTKSATSSGEIYN